MNSPVAAAPRPLRVAFCIDNMNVGGTELNAVRTAALLREHVELRVVALNGEGPLRERYRELGIPVHALPIPRLYGLETARQGLRLTRLLREHQVDILHAHDIYSNIFAGPWARLVGCGFVASRRWWEGGPRRLMRWGNRTSYRLAHAVLANSASVAGLVIEEGAPPQRVHVVPNFIDASAFCEPPVEWLAVTRERLAVAQAETTIVSVANLSPVKDHATLLRAFALAGEDDCHLLLIGADAGSMAELRRLSGALGIERRVHFAGFMANEPNPHFLGDVSVLSSVSEGLPNSLLEAMAAGRPIVATRVGAVPDVVRQGENGYLVSAGDAEAMAAALRELIRSRDKRRTLGGNGHRRARDEFSADKAVTRLLNLYAQISAR